MRIGISGTCIDPQLTQGKVDGIGIYTKELSEAFIKTHQTVIPYVFPPVRNPLFQSQLAHSQTAPLPYSIATAVGTLPGIGHLAHRKLENKIDIFHATDYRIPQLKKIPVVATLHDAIVLQHPEWYQGKFRWLKNNIMRYSAQWVDHVITHSQAVVNDIITHWHIPENKISAIPSGIDQTWFAPIAQEKQNKLLEKLNLHAKRFVLFVGTLQPKKNITNIILAHQSLPDEIQKEYPLILVGKGHWLSKEMQYLIQQLENNNRGKWLNYLSDEETKIMYQNAKIFLQPSLYEGFGFPILEAFASKTPIITSNISSMPEVAGDAAYLVDPYSVKEMSTAMEKLLTNDNLCQQLIKKGNERVKQYNWDKCAAETMKVYERLV